MKKITMLIAFLMAFSWGSYAQFPAPYCGPIVFTNNEEPITLVNFAGINNTSAAAVGGEAHQDFTAITGTVYQGISYPIAIKGNTDGPYQNYLRVFIDWNQDSDFLDPGESYDVGIIANSTGADAVVLNGTITVPPGATLGTTRMRVTKKYNAYSDSCNTGGGGWGEAEDYTLTVSTPPCSAPAATFAVVSLCPDSTFNVTANVTSLGDAASVSVSDNQSSPAQVLNAPGEVTFGPFAQGTPVVITVAHSNAICNLVSIPQTELACAPGCASAPSPADGATGIAYGPITLSWEAPTTGGAVEEYDLYAGNTPDALTYVGSYTDINTGTDLTINGFNATVYWQIVPVNGGGPATGCAVWSFTTESSPGYCLNGALYPTDPVVPAVCDGVTQNEITTASWAGEYSLITVTSGEPYVFLSSVATDFVTISNETGDIALAYGATPFAWTSTVTGNVRFYLHTNDQCGAQNVARTKSVICGTPSADAPDYAGLQWPPTMTITQGDTDIVYGQVYEPGVTDLAGQGAGITAWVGVNSTNTNPNTWVEGSWTPMTYNAACGGCTSNDEYMGEIGAGLDAGTYYYAVRFRLNAGAYVYGGTDGTNGDFWDGTTFISGVLTVNEPPAPANDECVGAVVLVPAGTFETGGIDTTNLGATGTDIASCQPDSGENVWYSVVVPAAGNITIETGSIDGSEFDDSIITVFSGSCGALVEIECDDDDSPDGFFSRVQLTGRTPGETLYISVWRYNNPFAAGDWGAFRISAYDASLSTTQFDSNNFAAYPNPVKDVLNLSSLQADITNVAVYNLLGQQVIAKSVNASQTQVDMSFLSAGTYMVKVSANSQTKTIKVIKQ